MATQFPQSPLVSSSRLSYFEDSLAPLPRYGRERRLQQAYYIFMDLVAVWACAFLAWSLLSFVRALGVLRAWDHPGRGMGERVGVLLLYSGLVLLFCNTQRLYSGVLSKSARDEQWGIAKAVGLATMLQLACIYLSRLDWTSMAMIVLTMLGSFVALVTWRRISRIRLQTNPTEICNVVIVGDKRHTDALQEELKRNPQFGYVVKAALDPTGASLHGLKSNSLPDFLTNLIAIVRTSFVDEVFVCHPDREIVKQVADRAMRCGLGVHIIPDLYDGLAWGVPLERLGRFPTLYLPRRPQPLLALMLKRMLDVLCSVSALCLTLPALLLIAAAIKLDSPGPVIYASARIGRRGRKFRCYKFRTMIADAEAQKHSLAHLNERDSVLFKISNDPRITRVGRVLRKYSLDELPQFWNVLKGDMSMVGPRPPLAAEVQQYQLEHLRRLDVLPGITGLWQVESRRNPSFESYISLDMQYVDCWHLWLDMKILFKTVSVVFAGSGE